MAGHKCVLEDLDGNIIFESVANGANYIDGFSFAINKPINGLKASTLDSGKVEVYLK